MLEEDKKINESNIEKISIPESVADTSDMKQQSVSKDFINISPSLSPSLSPSGKFVTQEKDETQKEGTTFATKEYLDKKTDELDKKIDKKIEELNRDKISIITISGIFVSIFTFISVEIQILKYICDFYKIVGFTLIFPGTLILFISLLDYVARSWLNSDTEIQENKTKQNNKYFKIIFVTIIGFMLIIVGLVIIWKSPDKSFKCNDSENYPIIQFNPEIKPSDVKINFPDMIKIQTVK